MAADDFHPHTTGPKDPPRAKPVGVYSETPASSELPGRRVGVYDRPGHSFRAMSLTIASVLVVLAVVALLWALGIFEL